MDSSNYRKSIVTCPCFVTKLVCIVRYYYIMWPAKTYTCMLYFTQGTVVFLFNHLKRVALQQAENKMTTSNLAVCFGPIFVLHQDGEHGEGEAGSMRLHIETVKYLLDIWPQDYSTNNKVVLWARKFFSHAKHRILRISAALCVFLTELYILWDICSMLK